MRLRSLVTGVGLQHDLLLRLEGGDAVGAGPDRLGLRLLAQLLDRLAGDDAAGSVGQGDPPEGGRRLLQVNPARVLAGDLDLFQRAPVALVRRFLASWCRDREPLEGELDVVGGHLAVAASEHLSRLQRELDQCVADLLDLLGGVELDVEIRLQGDEPLEDAGDDVGIMGPGPERRVDDIGIAANARGEAAACGQGATRPAQTSRRGRAGESLEHCAPGKRDGHRSLLLPVGRQAVDSGPPIGADRMEAPGRSERLDEGSTGAAARAPLGQVARKIPPSMEQRTPPEPCLRTTGADNSASQGACQGTGPSGQPEDPRQRRSRRGPSGP